MLYCLHPIALLIVSVAALAMTLCGVLCRVHERSRATFDRKLTCCTIYTSMGLAFILVILVKVAGDLDFASTLYADNLIVFSKL